MRYVMIMAGGAGTRLWPLSVGDTPKQLVPLIERAGERVPMLRLAAERAERLVPRDRVVLCTGEAHRAGVLDALPGYDHDQLLGEPVGRDTLNAVAFTAAVLHKRDPDAVFAVLTADQTIEPAEEFARCAETAFRLVEDDPRRLVTFSITPTFPATGYGYVERAEPIENTDGLAFTVRRFVEKPDEQRAREYLDAGTFAWNSGMFVWKASTVLELVRELRPKTYEGVTRIAEAWGTPDARRVLEEVYPTLEKISVDYALMEPVAQAQARGEGDARICTVVTDVRWLDVGSWPAYAETLTPDDAGNRVSGNAALHDSRDCLVVGGPDHLVALLGCEDLIVVRTQRATLVMPRGRAQDLKKLHAELPDDAR